MSATASTGCRKHANFLESIRRVLAERYSSFCSNSATLYNGSQRIMQNMTLGTLPSSSARRRPVRYGYTVDPNIQGIGRAGFPNRPVPYSRPGRGLQLVIDKPAVIPLPGTDCATMNAGPGTGISLSPFPRAQQSRHRAAPGACCHSSPLSAPAWFQGWLVCLRYAGGRPHIQPNGDHRRVRRASQRGCPHGFSGAWYKKMLYGNRNE